MAKSAAQRAREYRARKKQDRRKYQEHLEEERERTKSYYVPIDQQKRKGRQNTRRRWLRNQQRKRGRKGFVMETPPPSPTGEVETTPQSARGRKKVRRDRSAAYRRIEKLTVKLGKTETQLSKYKRRFYRLKNSTQASPIKLAKKLRKNPDEFRAACVLLCQLRRSYKRCTNVKDKQRLREQITYALARKFLVQKKIFTMTGMICKVPTGRDPSPTVRHQELVRSFYLRDDNSRNTAGKKETITRRGVKKQRRYLNESMKILHAKLLSENPGLALSYAKFCRMRPFWVLKPKVTDRQTCLCMKHENVDLMIEALCKVEVLSSRDPMVLIDKLVCDPKQKDCMYNICEVCKKYELDGLEKDVGDKIVNYFQWQTSTNDGRKVTVKVEHTSDCFDLYAKLEKELKTRFGKHIFNIMHQYAEIRKKRSTLSEDEAIVQIDFSENYGCKYGREVQSAHFGGAKGQVSLHTGVCYIGQTKVVPFCSMSNKMNHDPVGIWAHVMPILEKVAPSTQVRKLHLISDGPTTQYRNQSHFALSQIIPFSLGYKLVSWNFLEAGHGKGPADGIGGAIKRTADSFVANGGDIINAETMYRALIRSETSVQLFLTDDEHFEIPGRILNRTTSQRLPGTMKVHQLIYMDNCQTLKYRDVSCFCDVTELHACRCFDLQEFQVITKTNDKDRDDNNNNVNEPRDEAESRVGLVLPCKPSENFVGQWCCVRYNNKMYPGIITNVDEDELEVNTMNVGRNRYVWPLFKDQIWYSQDNILGFIPEPRKVTARHVKIDDVVHEELLKLMS